MLDKQGPEADISSCGASARLKGPLQLLQGKSFRHSSMTQTPINQLACHQYMIMLIAHANPYQQIQKQRKTEQKTDHLYLKSIN